jgi:hypothetical protein
MDAMPLRELQERFFSAIAAEPGTLQASPELLREVAPGSRLDAAGRLDVYAGMYWHRILDVLAEDFARTAALAGDDAFAGLARDYLRCRPSREPSIARVGEAFAAFLAGRAGPDLPPLLAEVARLEWARIAAFDAPDATPLALTDLVDLPAARWPALELAAIPSLRVHDFASPVQQALDPDFAGALAEQPTTLRIWRSGFVVYHATVDATERPALRLLCSGATFAQIGEACGEPEVAAALLARWLEDGIVVRQCLTDGARSRKEHESAS